MKEIADTCSRQYSDPFMLKTVKRMLRKPLLNSSPSIKRPLSKVLEIISPNYCKTDLY